MTKQGLQKQPILSKRGQKLKPKAREDSRGINWDVIKRKITGVLYELDPWVIVAQAILHAALCDNRQFCGIGEIENLWIIWKFVGVQHLNGFSSIEESRKGDNAIEHNLGLLLMGFPYKFNQWSLDITLDHRHLITPEALNAKNHA
jgi:hypothetical protein